MTTRLNVGQSFIGWDKIKHIIDSTQDKTTKLLILCLIKTGGRTQEVLSLNKKDFNMKLSKYSIVMTMPVLKKFERIKDEQGEFIKGKTNKLDIKRQFPVLLNEPLNDLWIKLMLASRKEFLFPRITRQQSWHRVSKTGKAAKIKINDHYFRGQRASQLSSEYGIKGQPLDEYFAWSKDMRVSRLRYSSYGWDGLELLMLEGKKRRADIYGL